MSYEGRLSKVLDTLATAAITVAAVAITWNVVTMKGRPQFGVPSGAAPPGLVENITDRHLTVQISQAKAADGYLPLVALIEFSDFECPFCGRHAHDTLPQVKKDFVDSGKILYAFKNFPLDGLHPHARQAAIAAACAQKNGTFWKMHQWLFANQRSLSEETVRAQAQTLSIDERCFGEMDSAIAADVAEGTRLSVNSTPTFFLGKLGRDGIVLLRRKINGAAPYETFKTEITSILAATD
jgi:protein-disulfide isomerase